MRVVRFMTVFAVLVAALALGAGSASAFSVSSSTASTQAGAPTDLTVTYVATGNESLGRLDVSLPPGVMHDPSVTGVCASATYQTDRCPSWSLAGSVSARVSVLGALVTVLGSIYRVADTPDSSEAEFGIVLRPPLSALGLTGKIFLRDRVTFTNGGGLRHLITGALSSVSVLGVSLRSQLARMALTYTGRNSTGNQLYNSTSCATTHLRATATFSDGRTEGRTAPYSAVGCDRLIFTGGFDFRTRAAAGTPKKSFASKLGSVAKASAGVTHEYHRVGAVIDLSELGDWDTSDLASEPACTNEEYITNTCPIRSQIGTVSTEIEGFPGTRRGAIYNSHPRGAKPRARINLRPGVTADFTLDFATAADGRATLMIDGLPQLPLTDISIDVDSPVFVEKGKPASCSNREVRAAILGHNGGQTNTTAKYPPAACPPNVSFADAGDADSDGDGLADESLKPESFDVAYEVADGGNGIDPDSALCELENPDPAAVVRGKVKVIRDNGGNGYTCEVSEAAGDVTVVFSVASIDGHVTVLKSSYNIDSEPPVLTSDAPATVEPRMLQFELFFDMYDDRLFHPQAEYTVECVIEDSDGNRTTTPGHKYIDTLTLRGGGECMWDTGRSGRFKLEVVVRDSGGHVTVLKRTAVVDAEGPTIKLTDVRDMDSDGDGWADDELRAESFDVPFEVNDAIQEDSPAVSCKLINPVAMDKDLRVADLDRDGRPDVCIVEDAPGGPVTVEITAVDWRGHVTVLKMSFTVDNQPPTIETTAPDKVVYDLSTFDYEFEFSDDTLSHPQSKFKAGVEIETKVGYQVSSARIITDRDSGRSKGFARFENVPDGVHQLTLTLSDSTGHVTVLKHSITVDAVPPALSTVDIRDEDADNDGIADSPLRSREFIVPFSVDEDPDLDGDDVQCTVAQTNPYFVNNGNAGEMPDGDGALFCPVAPPNGGPVTLTITATSRGGHVTVLKRSFTVDAQGPTIRITSAQDQDDDGDGFADDPLRGPAFDVPVDISDENGVAKTKCTVKGWNPEKKEPIIGVDDDGDGVIDRCRVEGAPGGPIVVVVTAEDVVGNAASTSRGFVVDAQGPTITVQDDADGDGTFDKIWQPANFRSPFRLSDASPIDPASVSCTVVDYNWRVSVADFDRDGIPDVCVIEAATPGAFVLEISAADVHGHVTVLKVAGEVEAPMLPPTIHSPTTGQNFESGSWMTVVHSMIGEGPYTYSCAVDGMVVSTACVSGFTFRVIGLGAGGHVLSVTARDEDGRLATASVTFQVVEPEPDVCVAIYPPPPGCPGSPGGGIITVP